MGFDHFSGLLRPACWNGTTPNSKLAWGQCMAQKKDGLQGNWEKFHMFWAPTLRHSYSKPKWLFIHVVKTIINHAFGNGTNTTHLWWFCGWFIIILTTFCVFNISSNSAKWSVNSGWSLGRFIGKTSRKHVKKQTNMVVPRRFYKFLIQFWSWQQLNRPWNMPRNWLSFYRLTINSIS